MIELNDVVFDPISGVKYFKDYVQIVENVNSGYYDKGQYGPDKELARSFILQEVVRKLVLSDLWFIVYFIMGITKANHPFVVKMCQEVANGPRTDTLDVWARFHFKSSIITKAETIQYHLKNPDNCTCIFSFKKPNAEHFLEGIRKVFEMPVMISCFPDVLYENPYTQSPSWSTDRGIKLKRKNTSRDEATVEASGLVEGMATSKHFERKIFDDVETPEMADSPTEMDKCYSRFDMAVTNLSTGSDDDINRIIGTFYHHNGPMVRIKNRTKADGSPQYISRIIPETDTGLPNGRPVFVSQEKHEELKRSEHYYSQQLCDPTPKSEQKLNPDFLKEIESVHLPRNLYKFLLVDPAGDRATNIIRMRQSDDWSIMLLGIEPGADETGAWKRYILDAFVDKLTESEAVEIICRMYLSGGMVQKFCYEKFSNFTPAVPMHVMEALKKKGRFISEVNKSLVWLRPASRNKHTFIANSLTWPLNNSKWFISKGVPVHYRERIKMEMEQFPYGNDDALNTMAYLDDIIKDETFRYSAVPKQQVIYKQPQVGVV